MTKTQFLPIFWVGDMQDPNIFGCKDFQGIYVFGFEFYLPYAHQRIQI